MCEFAYPYKKWQCFIPLKIFKELFPATPKIRNRGYELFHLFSIGWHFAQAPKLCFFRGNMANQSEQYPGGKSSSDYQRLFTTYAKKAI
jgi:hypothetical protein